MRFSAREDIAASSEAVFAAISDFETIERQALRRGIEVERLDQLTEPGAGMSWRLQFSYRGRRREAVTTLSRYAPAEALEFQSTSGGIECEGVFDLTRLGKAKTRLHVTFDLRPQTFRARLLIQALRIGKSNLSNRFKNRIARFARHVER